MILDLLRTGFRVPIHTLQNAFFIKSDPGMGFAPAWNKAVGFGNTTEEFQCSRVFTRMYNGNGIPMHKFPSSPIFEVGPLLLPCSLVDIRPFLRPLPELYPLVDLLAEL
jgi:hypothetical protein